MIKVFFVFVVLCHSTAILGNGIFRSDYKYYEDVNGWVKLHKIPADWQDARLRCHAEGAILASPINSNLRDTMIFMMTTQTYQSNSGIYSGIHSTFTNGSYSSIEGVPVSSVAANWITGQPDNVYTEQCVVFHRNGTLEDVPCSNPYEFICYKKYEHLTMNKCGTVDNEYMWDDRTGHCYKFHRHGQTWSRAQMTCTAEGGYLAIINSDAEANVLIDLFAKYPKTIIFARENEFAFVGMSEWPDEFSWFTVHGQTLTEAGYDKWYSGQPDNIYRDGVTQDCGCIRRSALLDDIWCNQITPFICEKDPNTSYNIN